MLKSRKTPFRAKLYLTHCTGFNELYPIVSTVALATIISLTLTYSIRRGSRIGGPHFSKTLLILLSIIAVSAAIPLASARCPSPTPPPPPEPEYPELTALAIGLSAGAASLFTPCGLPLLPAYAYYYLGKSAKKMSGLIGGLSATMGLLFAFGILGVIVSSIGGLIYSYISALEFLAALIPTVAGLAILFKIPIKIIPSPKVAPSRLGNPGLFLFGMSWGMAVIACAPYVFISTVFYAISKADLGILVFIGYGLGLGLLTTVITLLVISGRRGLIQKMVRSAHIVQRLSGIVLVLIGGALFIYTYLVFPLYPRILSIERLVIVLVLLVISASAFYLRFVLNKESLKVVKSSS